MNSLSLESSVSQALASPGKGHWGTCPLISNNFFSWLWNWTKSDSDFVWSLQTFYSLWQQLFRVTNYFHLGLVSAPVAPNPDNTNKKHLKNVGPIPYCELPHAHSPGVASGTVARRLRIDVHDNNDNAWQRGPLWPHGMGPIRAVVCRNELNTLNLSIPACNSSDAKSSGAEKTN